MSPTPTEQDRLTSDLTANLIVLARNAAANVDPADPVDYWYRLGQRNAYAHATGMLLAPDLGQGAFRIAERLTAALDAKETDLARLRSAAYGLGVGDGASAGLEWIGPRAFAARYGQVPGLDHDYGFLWGVRDDQRISLRITDGHDIGLLYVYDRTWDEYAVLTELAERAAVERANTCAATGDVYLDPRRFAQLVIEPQPITEEARLEAATPQEYGAQL